MNKIQMVIKRVYENHHPRLSDIEFLLGLKDYDDIASILDFADNVRRQYCGDGVIVRAIVEFSSFCRNTCMYCGLNRNNTFLKRYRLSEEEILKAIKVIYDTNIKTVVLQSGEDEHLDPIWFANVISRIKNSFDIAITLSVGQRTADEYRLWKNAGADRYLLKIETSNKALYNSLHPEMSFDERVYCSRILGSIGYQNGSGCLIGLKNQTTAMLAEDVLFFKRENFDMIGIGLFIPHEHTPLGKEPLGDLKMTLKTLALTRIVTKNTHLPATTSIGCLEGDLKALQAGANVIMFNFTPKKYQQLYQIYPDKNSLVQKPNYLSCFESNINKTGRWLDYSTGDSLKQKYICM